MAALPVRTLALISALVVGLGSPAAAHAQVPGAIDTGTVVITDSNRLVVSVDAAQATATNVTGRIQNTTGTGFRCATPGVQGLEYPGQVTEAEIVARSMRYYANNIFQPIGGVGLDITGIELDPIPIGSLLDILPTGSVNKALGATRSDLMDIRSAQEAARVAGHTGDPRVGGNVAFTVGANASVTWSAQLGAPASGQRTDFQAAALFFCTETTGARRAHVFAGYEGGVAPVL
ncbi:hypothetical protein G6027_14730 [Dietzia sp. SLG310A2-38A2]|uniref:hypothetical protein n=1 Tax=Dietzia sp. SLG310A2-38A2 TaxID=1630643 RepID=UPI0015FDF90F|nr:hypothetical protein [Dietzia sp. SLG310A2-38A2]MBB1032110.1 hypothetical protein [Dietzia sp. SLG310A2-38A2]